MVDDCPDILRTNLFSDSPGKTRSIAYAIGERCKGGETIFLFGDLGSGKTCFVQGLAQGLGVPPSIRVTSPTFTLHGEYNGRLALNHLDLYRLDEPASLDGLGIEEMLLDRTTVTAVEWPEIMESLVGGERIEVRLVDAGEGLREIFFTAFGARHRRLID